MRFVDCEQGSPEWLHARYGRITASRMSDVLAYRKDGKPAAGRTDYAVELVAERISGFVSEHFVSYDMKRGTELEPAARTEYELRHDVLLDRIGFALHPTLEFTGASPDGLVADGGVEIKCPKPTTHVEYLLAGTIPLEYAPQMVWNMVCCERQWWDFMSYCPPFPPLIVRMRRDEKIIEEMTAEVIKFHGEVEELTAKIKRLT